MGTGAPEILSSELHVCVRMAQSSTWVSASVSVERDCVRISLREDYEEMPQGGADRIVSGLAITQTGNSTTWRFREHVATFFPKTYQRILCDWTQVRGLSCSRMILYCGCYPCII